MIKKLEFVEESEFDTVLGEDVQFQGNIETTETGLIKGKITNCQVNASVLVVVEKGLASGEIVVDTLSVLGECEGNIRVKDTLSLLKGGSIQGKIWTKTLIIGEGGKLNAMCNMEEKK